MASQRVYQELATIIRYGKTEMIGNRLVHVKSSGHAKHRGEVDPIFVMRIAIGGDRTGIDG